MDKTQFYYVLGLLFAITGYLIKRLIDSYDKKHNDFDTRMSQIRKKVEDDVKDFKKLLEDFNSKLYNHEKIVVDYSNKTKEQFLKIGYDLDKSKTELKAYADGFISKVETLDLSMQKIVDESAKNNSVLGNLNGKILTFEKKDKDTTKTLVEYRKVIKKHNELLSDLVKKKKEG